MLKLKINIKEGSLEYKSYLNILDPVGKYVVIKKMEREEKTEGGIIIPLNVEDDSNFGIVVGINSHGHQSEKFYVNHTGIEIGDIVVYAKWCEKEIEAKGKKLHVIEYPEIHGFIKKDYFLKNK